MKNKSIKRMAAVLLAISAFGIIEPASYTHIITTKAYAESKTYLKGISLSDGDIKFSDNQYSYMVDVDKDVEEIIVRAKPEDDDYKVKINGETATKEDKYRETLNLNEGKNKIEIQVSDSSDNEVTYTLYVYRGGKEAVYLKDINIDERSIGFNRNTSFYNIELDDDTELIKLDSITEGDEYTVKVNDKVLSSTNSIKLKFSGIGKYVINITVTDNETKREKLYTLGIYIGIPVSPDISGSINKILKPNQWIIVNGRWRYNDSLGKCIKEAWFYDRNYKSYFYFNQKGNMETGWVQDGNWYYLDEHGAMKTGWLLYDGEWYYLNSSGAMETGWIEDNGEWYYLNLDGEMCTGWIVSGNKWYLLDSNGIMETGWILQRGKWYYLNSDGSMQTGWLKSSDDWYYLNSDGSMKGGEWIFNNGSWYYINYAGNMRRGWLYKDDEYYYLNDDGTMNTSRKTIDGYTYNFNKDGSVNFD